MARFFILHVNRPIDGATIVSKTVEWFHLAISIGSSTR